MGQRLATVDEFKASGLPPGANSVADTVLGAVLDEASASVTSYLRKRYAPPYVSWGADVRRATIAIARLYLLERRGFGGTGADESIRAAAADVTTWLREVSRGEAEVEITDATSVEEATPLASSEAGLGWAAITGIDRVTW